MRRWAGALIAALVVGMSIGRAQDSAPALPSALYVLNNAGQVSQLDTSALTITPITPRQKRRTPSSSIWGSMRSVNGWHIAPLTACSFAISLAA
ncbi:MAG: hypothetical protein CUN53_17155, partial [Phototrophicales bacterium]